MTEEEKNKIREQHTGGMKVMTENFSKLVNSKLGDSKPLVSEQTPYGFKEPTSYKNSEVEVDQYDDTDFRSSKFNSEKRELMRKKQQIQDVINNFESIDCDNYSFVDAEDLTYPEYLQIYCDSYKGRSKKYMQQLLNSL